jgi:hypothetical protein
MKVVLRNIARRVGHPNGAWLTLLVALVVAAPSVGLLWFMNRAVQNERLAVRQKLVEAYRGHLALAQERLELHWRQIGATLDEQADHLTALELFARQVRAGVADAVICLDATGGVTYPGNALPPKYVADDDAWTEAQGSSGPIPAPRPPRSPAWPNKPPTPTGPRAPYRLRRAASFAPARRPRPSGC